MNTLDYIKNFIQDRDVASLTPTSERTVKNICSRIDFSNDLLLVEYGPGNGVFSEYILKKMSPGSRLILIEANEKFVNHLKQIFTDPRVSVHNLLAGNVASVLSADDMGNVDLVLSGIPFSFLDSNQQTMVLKATKAILKEGGVFLAYQTGGHLKKPLKEIFGNVDSDIEMLNIPPYVITKSVKESGG